MVWSCCGIFSASWQMGWDGINSGVLENQFGKKRCNKGLFGFRTVGQLHCRCNGCLDWGLSLLNATQVSALNAECWSWWYATTNVPGVQWFWSPPKTGHSHRTWVGWSQRRPGKVQNELLVQNIKFTLSNLDWPLRMVWVEAVYLKTIMKVIESMLKCTLSSMSEKNL